MSTTFTADIEMSYLDGFQNAAFCCIGETIDEDVLLAFVTLFGGPPKQRHSIVAGTQMGHDDGIGDLIRFRQFIQFGQRKMALGTMSFHAEINSFRVCRLIFVEQR